jgi:molybdopterin-guanine dinucleotide biosynthesis protein A
MRAGGYDAVVLAGGSARRLGGVAKPQLPIDGVSLLDRVLAAVSGAERVIVAGPQQPVSAPVIWVREEPPGGGPVAGLAAALPETSAPVVVVLAADLPWVAPAVAPLVSAVSGTTAAVEVALLADADGRVNFLAAAWRRDALAAALAGIEQPHGAAAKHLLRGLDPALVIDTGGWGADCDTWDDVRAARESVGEPSIQPER